MVVHIIFLVFSLFINKVVSDELPALNDISDESPVIINEELDSSPDNSSEVVLARGHAHVGQRPGLCRAVYGPCMKSTYRSYDGTCNNLRYPTLGSTYTPYSRLIPAHYADGIHMPRVSVKGTHLPGARILSSVLFPEKVADDPVWTLDAMQWGQVISHDMSFSLGDPQVGPMFDQCCTPEGHLLMNFHQNPNQCYPILVPSNDPYYSKFGISCIAFIRSGTNVQLGCAPKNSPHQQLVRVSHYMDASLLYGSSMEEAHSLRLGKGGRLLVEVRNGRQWPPSAWNKTVLCEVRSERETCYRFGDERGNQNPQLTILQIILVREHNRIADKLRYLNPHWSDGKTYQQARRILIAEYQHINYEEWLPIFLGRNNTLKYGLRYETEGYVNDYREDVDPSVLNEHANAAFRYFHTAVQSHLQLRGEGRDSHGFLRLSDHYNRPGIIEVGNNMDFLTVGLSTQNQESIDPFLSGEISNNLFRNGKPYGQDLQALGVQRDRDHGIASYNDYRQFCKLPRAKNWKDFTDYISPEIVDLMSQMYMSPEDVDLTVGGYLENVDPPVGLAGPTFLCIMLEQFYRTRVGDRFYYQNVNAGFTPGQLREIRKATVSRLICDNGDNIKGMQVEGFRIVSPERNPVVSCSDTQSIPVVDLSLWKEKRRPSYSKGAVLDQEDLDIEHAIPVVEDLEEEDILFE